MMHEIKDLSDLLTLLAKPSAEPLQFELSPELKGSLKGCLELGINQIASFDIMVMTPRQRSKTAEDPHMPIQRVWPKDFARYLAGTTESDPAVISVDRSLLAEGLGYLEDYDRSERFATIFDGLEALTKDVIKSRVQAQQAHVEEVADWLDLIWRDRPNEIARELRHDVKQHNESGLRGKIRAPKARSIT
jgi:hypothetical protein